MKIVAISDTHNRHNKIKSFWTKDQNNKELEALGGDVIIHSGDATGRGEKGEILPFLDWFAELDFRFKFLFLETMIGVLKKLQRFTEKNVKSAALYC